MIEKWVNFKRDYLEISFLRENCDTTVRMTADEIMKKYDIPAHENTSVVLRTI